MTTVNKKILHIVNGEFFAGAEKVQHIIGTYFSDKNYDILFATLFDGEFEKVCQGNRYKIKHFHMRSKFDLLVGIKIGKLVQKEKYQIIHVHTVRSSIIGLIASLVSGVPIIEHVHSPALRESDKKIKNIFNYLLSRVIKLFVRKVICVSNSLRLGLISAGMNSDKVITVHNGVSVKKNVIRKEIDDLLVIGMVALFRERKGVKKQSYFNQISRSPSSAVELKDVESNKGVTIDD